MKAWQDKTQPGIIRFNDDPTDGLVAGARAPEIVRAVNAHDDLVAALRAAQEELRLLRMKDTDAVYQPGLSVQISLALTKAEGREP